MFNPTTYRGRVIVYHGLGTTAGAFSTTDPFDDLIAGLQDQEWAVSLFDYDAIVASLTSKFNADATGATYRAEIVDEYDALLPSLPEVGGPLVLLGISWGGLAAMQCAGRGAVTPDGVVVHLPALDPNLLTEFTSYSLSSLESLNTAVLDTIPDVYASWATDDTRVGYTVAKNLVENILMCDGHEYTSLGHTTNAAVVSDLLAYVDTIT